MDSSVLCLHHQYKNKQNKQNNQGNYVLPRHSSSVREGEKRRSMPLTRCFAGTKLEVKLSSPRCGKGVTGHGLLVIRLKRALLHHLGVGGAKWSNESNTCNVALAIGWVARLPFPRRKLAGPAHLQPAHPTLPDFSQPSSCSPAVDRAEA